VPSPTFGARVDLVVLQVAVVDPHRRFVAGLQREDFSVYEEGVRQAIVLFASAAVPLDVLLLIDISASMTAQLSFVQEAAIDLLGTLRPGDRAGVVFFHSAVHLAHALSEDRDSVARAIRGAHPGGATAAYEAIYIGLDELLRAAPIDGAARRQAVIVLTDGVDNSSRVAFEDVLSVARGRAVTIYTILPGANAMANMGWPGLRWRDAAASFQMRRLAEDTGGRVFTPTAAADLKPIYDDIASELSQQYWLAYAPSTPSPGFRRVSVRVDSRPDLLARTRSGYDAGRSVSVPSGSRHRATR
jgi:VWFA-related protein